MSYLKFDFQNHQDECSSNIIRVLKESKGIEDLSLLDTGINKLHTERNIPIKDRSQLKRLDVLMETGTGKTFTYIETMYKLNKEYGIKKFIIFVPRIAIREGVLQNIDLTADYFKEIYGKRIKKYTYDSKGGMWQVEEFIRNVNELSVLILTSTSIAAKNTSNKILVKPRGKQREIFGFIDKSPLDEIRKLKPVIFIDEPHLLKGHGFNKVYKDYFSDLLCIRFGATYPDGDEHRISNVVYVLDSLQSFRESLVKQIFVHTAGIGAESGTVRFMKKVKHEKSVLVTYTINNMVKKKEISYGEDIGVGDYKGVNIIRVKNNISYLSNKTMRQTVCNGL